MCLPSSGFWGVTCVQLQHPVHSFIPTQLWRKAILFTSIKLSPLKDHQLLQRQKAKLNLIFFFLNFTISDFLKTILKLFPRPNFVSLGPYFKPSYSEILHLHVKPVRFEYESIRTVLCVQSLSVIKQKHQKNKQFYSFFR